MGSFARIHSEKICPIDAFQQLLQDHLATINDSQIDRVSSFKYLSVWLTATLSPILRQFHKCFQQKCITFSDMNSVVACIIWLAAEAVGLGYLREQKTVFVVTMEWQTLLARYQTHSSSFKNRA